MCNRTRSVLTHLVIVIEEWKDNMHQALQAKVSGQLPNLGLIQACFKKDRWDQLDQALTAFNAEEKQGKH